VAQSCSVSCSLVLCSRVAWSVLLAFTYIHLAILLPCSSSDVTPEPSSSAAWSAQVLLKNKNNTQFKLSTVTEVYTMMWPHLHGCCQFRWCHPFAVDGACPPATRKCNAVQQLNRQHSPGRSSTSNSKSGGSCSSTTSKVRSSTACINTVLSTCHSVVTTPLSVRRLVNKQAGR
jgi:hypothetical protein